MEYTDIGKCNKEYKDFNWIKLILFTKRLHHGFIEKTEPAKAHHQTDYGLVNRDEGKITILGR